MIHYVSIRQRAGCKNEGESDEERICAWTDCRRFCGSAWVRNYSHSKMWKMHKEKLSPSAAMNLMGREDEGGRGKRGGERGWMLLDGGRGPHLTCMSSRIRVRIVLLRCYITGCSWEICYILFIYIYLSYLGSWSRGGGAASRNTQTVKS